MTACNDCGACCSPVQLPYSQNDLRFAAPWQVDPEMRRWVLEDLTPIPKRDGLARSPHLTQGGTTFAIIGGQPSAVTAFFYECRHYDPDNRACLNYENRPEVCSEYPWYGEGPDPSKALPLTCSYLADVGRPVADVPVPAPRRR